MRYFLIALALHLSLFYLPDRFLTKGTPVLTKKFTIPVSYNVKALDPRVDNIKKTKGDQAKKAAPPKIKKEESPKTRPEEPKKVKSEVPSKPKEAKKISEKKKPPKVKKIKKDFKSTIKDIPSEVKEIEPSVEEVVTEVAIRKQENPAPVAEQQKESDNPVNEKTSKAEKTAPDGEDDTFAKSGNFTANSDGSYTAHSTKGLDFEIIYQVDPNYPRQAEVMRYGKTVVVEARFLVDVNGRVEKIELTKSFKKFGFDKEVVTALKKWKFKPIVYKGKKMKVYFNKEFVFKSKS